MKFEVQTINIDGIECYEKDGVVYLKLEAVARGLGFTKTETKNGTEYTTVRWERVFNLLTEIGFDHKWAKDGFIPENIFYRLAMKAKNETAERFQAKIADEVVPSIRKHGAYMTEDTIDRMIASPEFGIKLLTELKAEQDKRKALEEKVKADAPAVFFAEAVTGADTNILIRDMAKLLAQNGTDIGGNRLYEVLRRDGYLIKSGSDYNMPTQRAMELGLFFVKETPRIAKEGAVIDRTTKVTPKGQKYFINRYAPKKALEQ